MRFLGLRWTPGERDQARAARAMAENLSSGWTTLVDWRGFMLLHSGQGQVETLPHGMGVVFGERHGKAPDPSPPCEAAVDPVPCWIAERWGAYIAVLVDRGYDIVRVLRDPSGTLPCFLAEISGVRAFFSDARNYVALAPEPEADLGFMRAFLRYPLCLSRRTGIAGVEELWPGECAVFPRVGRELKTYWTPHRYARVNRNLDWTEGRAALRAGAEAAVREQASVHSRIALRLSGGFDSSVMLALLRRTSEAEVVCVNEYWEGAPEGDERLHAKAVARLCGVPFHELRMDPREVDYERTLLAPLTVRPTLALLSYGSPDVAAFYAGLDCNLITSGQGGDHLFHRSRTSLIAADAVRDGVLDERALRIAMDTARLAGVHVWEVFAAMAAGALHIPPPLRHRSSVMGVLSDDDENDALPEHLWLKEARRASPARSLRIRQLLDALSYHDDTVLSTAAPTRPLFLSQPVIETCLRIPPYVMTDGGGERALARAAFADLVPEAVTRRTAKGETTRYFSAVLGANWQWIASLLREGRLIQFRVADKDAMTRALSRNWRQDGLATDGLYALIAGECWLRNFERETGNAATARLAEAQASADTSAQD